VIDFIATDHASYLEEKAQEYPNTPSGMPGWKHRPDAPHRLGRDAAQLLRYLIGCQRLWLRRMVFPKGCDRPGYDADLVLVDLNTYRPVLRGVVNQGWSPFEGWNLTGWPVMTVVGGQIVYDRGHLNTEVRGEALTFPRGK